MMSLKKKLEDMMNNEYQEAVKKNVHINLVRKKFIKELFLNGDGFYLLSLHLMIFCYGYQVQHLLSLLL